MSDDAMRAAARAMNANSPMASFVAGLDKDTAWALVSFMLDARPHLIDLTCVKLEAQFEKHRFATQRRFKCGTKAASPPRGDGTWSKQKCCCADCYQTESHDGPLGRCDDCPYTSEVES